MKKILSFLLMTITVQEGFGYFSQNGPLMLGDQMQVNQLTFARSVKRGIIMNAITTDPNFTTELTNLHQFLNIPLNQALPSYEEIVEILQISTNNSGTVAVIEAFEKAIMRYLHYNQYLCCTEGKTVNIFIAGIKYNWFYPSEWTNLDNWTKSCNSQETRQLIAELDVLANIAQKHSIVTAKRLKTKVESYLNWKANMLKTITVLGTIGLTIAYRENICNACSLIGTKAISVKDSFVDTAQAITNFIR